MAHYIITNKPFTRKDGTSQIIVRYTWKGKHYTKPILNLYCKPNQLDKSSQMITKGYDKIFMKKMNQKINEVKSQGNQILLDWEDPEPDKFFEFLFEIPREEKKKKPYCLVDLYEEWLNIGANSVVYSTTLPHLIDFKGHRGSLPVSEYSKTLLREFEKHLMNNGYIPYNHRMKRSTPYHSLKLKQVAM